MNQTYMSLNKTEWWSSLDAYWKRFFKIKLRPNLDSDRQARDQYTPGEKELDQLFKLDHLDVTNCSVSSLAPLESLPLTSLTLSSLSSLKSLTGLENLDLAYLALKHCGNITDITLLESQKNLMRLELAGNGLGNLQSVGKLRELTSLVIAGEKVVDLKFIGELNKLEELVFSDLDVDLTPISALTQLKKIFIRNTKLPTFEKIGPLPSLTHLHFLNGITESLRGVEKFPSLIELVLHHCTTDDLNLVCELSILKTLDITSTGIKDLTALNASKSLAEIFIPEDNFSRDAILEFQAKHPKCKIYSERGRSFPFMKHKRYTVTKELNDLKPGMNVQFSSYQYNHYDSVGIYYFKTDNNREVRVDAFWQEDLNWKEHLTEN
ncbi:hypothetical protein WSM22_25790 [Cytophagales bacterium WSM2-2]|nr:hypothetical protein WSM22_25790 [Cytophagales bacterium WSM2-2]